MLKIKEYFGTSKSENVVFFKSILFNKFRQHLRGEYVLEKCLPFSEISEQNLKSLISYCNPTSTELQNQLKSPFKSLSYSAKPDRRSLSKKNKTTTREDLQQGDESRLLMSCVNFSNQRRGEKMKSDTIPESRLKTSSRFMSNENPVPSIRHNKKRLQDSKVSMRSRLGLEVGSPLLSRNSAKMMFFGSKSRSGSRSGSRFEEQMNQTRTHSLQSDTFNPISKVETFSNLKSFSEVENLNVNEVNRTNEGSRSFRSTNTNDFNRTQIHAEIVDHKKQNCLRVYIKPSKKRSLSIQMKEEMLSLKKTSESSGSNQKCGFGSLKWGYICEK